MNDHKKKLRDVLEKTNAETMLPVVKISLKVPTEDEPELELTDSKFSGTPYIPHDEEAPVSGSGTPLVLLAQMDLSKIKGHGGLPKKGLLQFFIADSEDYGISDEKGYAVRYYPEIDKTVTEDECSEKYCPEISENFPVQMEYKLEFENAEEPMTVFDYRFDGEFTKNYNAAFPEKKISCIADLNDNDMEFLFADDDDPDEGQPAEHKLLGYPIFDQEDPRNGTEYEKYDRLLFMIDCDMSEYIMFGDGGGACFFISSEKLKNADFSDIMYTWDCF